MWTKNILDFSCGKARIIISIQLKKNFNCQFYAGYFLVLRLAALRHFTEPSLEGVGGLPTLGLPLPPGIEGFKKRNRKSKNDSNLLEPVCCKKWQKKVPVKKLVC